MPQRSGSKIVEPRIARGHQRRVLVHHQRHARAQRKRAADEHILLALRAQHHGLALRASVHRALDARRIQRSSHLSRQSLRSARRSPHPASTQAAGICGSVTVRVVLRKQKPKQNKNWQRAQTCERDSRLGAFKTPISAGGCTSPRMAQLINRTKSNSLTDATHTRSFSAEPAREASEPVPRRPRSCRTSPAACGRRCTRCRARDRRTRRRFPFRTSPWP